MKATNSSTFYLICILLSLVKHLSAFYITVDAHAEECFFERATTGTKMGLIYEVVEGGFYDIDISVKGKFYFFIR
jgi:hypothetical protein